MRRLILACLLLDFTAAKAQEPLLLRIRPPDAAPREMGGAGDPPSAETIARARAAREAVWERSDRRARIAIATVCTGCLPPERSAPPAPATMEAPGPPPAADDAATAPPAQSLAQTGTP